jgi:hypothetical protein
MLNAIVAINPEAVNEARKEQNKSNNDHQFTVFQYLKTIQTFRACLPLQEHIACYATISLQMPLSLPNKDKGAII